MEKFKYSPFLKLKVNEVAALVELDENVKNKVVPFFDLARKDGMTDATFASMLKKSAVKLKKHWGVERPFFIDNYDIPDEIKVDDQANISQVLIDFCGLKFIPVVGLNRTAEHNDVVFKALADGIVNSGYVAIRLMEDDFESWELIFPELQELIKNIGQKHGLILILDNRLCPKIPFEVQAAKMSKFITEAGKKADFVKIIVTGSSIPAAIADLVKTKNVETIARVEVKIFGKLLENVASNKLCFGDYTIVSPLYSDVTLPGEMLLGITAPKVLYSYGDLHYVARGGRLKTHPRGHRQYHDLIRGITEQDFARESNYSFGDAFLHEKKIEGGKKITPGTILKPTINAHMTYMANV